MTPRLARAMVASLVSSTLTYGTYARPAHEQPQPAPPPAPAPAAPAPPQPEAPAWEKEQGPVQQAEPYPAQPAQPYPQGYPPPGYPPPPPYGHAPVPGYGVMAPASSNAPNRYRYENKPRYALVGAGAGVFGGAYLIGVVFAAAYEFRNKSSWLAAPIIGPWVHLQQRDWSDCEDDSDFGFACTDEELADILIGVFVTFEGVAQLGGIAMFIAGFAAPKQVAVPVAVRPLVSPSAKGLELSVSF